MDFWGGFIGSGFLCRSRLVSGRSVFGDKDECKALFDIIFGGSSWKERCTDPCKEAIAALPRAGSRCSRLETQMRRREDGENFLVPLPEPNDILRPFMASILLEDNFSDILGKAQRGLKLSDDQLAKRAGLSLSDLGRAQSGERDEKVIRKLASALNLRAAALIESANRAWAPNPVAVPGLAQFNTAYRDMTVNCYLAWDTQTREAVVFDTGADCGPVLQFVKANQLALKLILLTHTHSDHVADLARLKRETGAPAHVCQLEAIEGAES